MNARSRFLFVPALLLAGPAISWAIDQDERPAVDARTAPGEMAVETIDQDKRRKPSRGDGDAQKPGRKKKDAAKPGAVKDPAAPRKEGKGKGKGKKKADAAGDDAIPGEVVVVEATPAMVDEQVEVLARAVTELTLERDRLMAANAIADETLKQELAERRAAVERSQLELEEANQQLEQATLAHRKDLEAELAELRTSKERLVLEAEIAKAESDAELSRFKLLAEERKDRLGQLDTEISEKEKRVERENYADQEPLRLADPVQGKSLIISDRRVSLNGPIYDDTAEAVSERINYFNNKDQQLPIFIVIDYSPGGSVMSGYKILKAMEGSDAPIYVVVKSFAASMAACITTLADKSFAYPNALILHHQLSGFTYGNLRMQQESVEETEEWWRRLAGPVAAKMEVSLDEFVELMYQNASTGDWVEFADAAKKLKWIDTIIEEIRETSLIKNPDAKKKEASSAATYHFGLEEKVDEKGAAHVLLPRLAPFDYYWLYNPDGYYRASP